MTESGIHRSTEPIVTNYICYLHRYSVSSDLDLPKSTGRCLNWQIMFYSSFELGSSKLRDVVLIRVTSK